MSRKEYENPFLETQLVSREIKKAITKAGYKWRPYVFRSYFATALDIAESKGEISHPWRQFFMGVLLNFRYDNTGFIDTEMYDPAFPSFSIFLCN